MSWEYVSGYQQIMRLAYQVQGMDIEGFLKVTKHALKVGPLEEPGVFRKGIVNITTTQAVAKELRKFQQATARILRMEGYPRERFWARGQSDG